MMNGLESQWNGFLLVDKPAGMTSHDVVDRVRALSGIRRVGHSGTLDPFATGLLILGIGRATKELGKIQGLQKTYLATMQLGVTSTTGDPTGIITAFPRLSSRAKPRDLDVQSILRRFIGPITQIPPMYSAKKVGGKKLYELAREGRTIERKSNTVTIHALKLLGYVWPAAEIEVACSSGTYIRTLVEDIGNALGCGAYTQALRRTAIGLWQVEDAQPLKKVTSENWQASLLPVRSALDKIISVAYTANTIHHGGNNN